MNDWYKDSVFYELHVKAFYDSNADGVGDFRGLIEKLDYLEHLGVDCLWLLPFYRSPLKDDGYDISDYDSILPQYGDVEQFRLFLHEAHKRGLRVMTELVLNHTSDQHPWFQEARASRSSPKRDWYVWSDDDRRYKEARVIFVDAERSNWAWDPVSGQHYWHRFFSHQPDLNFDNPEVRDEVKRVMRFWLGMGVDALRLDAVPYLFEREGTNCENLPRTHEFLKELRADADRTYGGRMLLAEANQWPDDVVQYFGAGDECHMCFHFPLMPRLFMALRKETSLPVAEIIGRTPAIPESCQWGLFLRNHDELTLEMVTDEERDYMYREYAKDPKMRRNIGICRRLAPLVENGRRQMELLHALLFSLHGSPVLYYGDELGMGDNVYIGDRNGVRTPMQWTGDRNAGFSRADPAQLFAPPVMDPVFGYQAVNVEAQLRSPTSFLNWTQRMLKVRKQYAVFGRGSIEVLKPSNPKVLAFLRSLTDQNVLVVANLSRFVQSAMLDLSRFKGSVPVELVGGHAFPPIGDLPYFFTFAPHAFYWLKLTPST